MKRQTSGALAIGVVVVVVAALLAIFNQSRTFAQTMGQDYDPGQIQAIHVALYAPDDAQSRQVTLSPTDPAAQELLTLLGSQMYDVVYSFGTVSGGYSAPYGYLANLAIRLPEKGIGYSWASITLSGEPSCRSPALTSRVTKHTGQIPPCRRRSWTCCWPNPTKQSRRPEVAPHPPGPVARCQRRQALPQ